MYCTDTILDRDKEAVISMTGDCLQNLGTDISTKLGSPNKHPKGSAAKPKKTPTKGMEAEEF